MVSCILFTYRNKVDVSIHYSWLNSIAMSIVRVISLVLIIIRYAMYSSTQGLASYEIKYLTFYGFLLALIYYCCVVLHFLLDKLLFKNESSIGKVIAQCINIMYEFTLSIQFTLTLLYWILLSGGPNEGGFQNLGIHLMPLLLLLLDFLFNSYQFPIRHIIITFIMAGIYIIINQVHTCDGDQVYDVYECGDPKIPLVAFVMLSVCHAMGHLVWKFWRGKKITAQLDKVNKESLLEQI